MPPALLTAALWSGLLILLMIVLSARVVLGRRKHRVSMGDGADGQMTVLARSFGNAAEYIPVGVAAMTLVALTGGSTLIVHLIGGGLFLGRLVHPLGLAIKKAPNWARITGMLLTWLSLGLAAVMLVMAGLTSI